MITKADTGIWCDYCKLQWGKVKNEWHPKAQTQAIWTVYGVHKSKGQKRHYCQSCLLVVTQFEGTYALPAYFWSLKDQVEAVAPIQTELEGLLNGK